MTDKRLLNKEELQGTLDTAWGFCFDEKQYRCIETVIMGAISLQLDKDEDRYTKAQLAKGGKEMKSLVKCSICKKSMDGREALEHVKRTGHNNWELIIKKNDKCTECGGEGSKSIVSENLVDRWSCPKCQGTGEVSSPDREDVAKLVWQKEYDRERNAGKILVEVKWELLPEWSQNYYLEIADQIKALFPDIEEVKTRMKEELTDLVDQMLKLHKREIEQAKREERDENIRV